MRVLWTRLTIQGPGTGLLSVPPHLTLKNSTFCPHISHARVCIHLRTCIFSLYSMNGVVFVTEME